MSFSTRNYDDDVVKTLLKSPVIELNRADAQFYMILLNSFKKPRKVSKFIKLIMIKKLNVI